MVDMLKSYNPADGQLIGQVPITPIDSISDIVSESRKAQLIWGSLSIDERIDYIARTAEKINRRINEIRYLLSKEMGKNLLKATSEVQSCTYSRQTANLVKEALKPQTVSGFGIETVIEHIPLGVCAIISPWNYPVLMAHWMIIPALTAGNTVILKPSEETPLVAQAYVDTLNEVLPKNVLQIVHGTEEQGKALVDMPGIAFVGFTGSKETGKKIMAGASGTLKRMILELGGKDPLIVMRDADIGRAAKFTVANSLENAGQMCVSTERVFVDEFIAEEFCKKLVEDIQGYKAGDFSDPDAEIGPIINEKQRQYILNQIEDALKKGAKIIFGGTDHPEHFILPTILDHITDDMLIAREETFGPVVCISRYASIDKAVESANSTDLGLGAVVFGNHGAETVADRLEAGMIGINTGVGGIGDSPWVGAKQSGYGFHGSADGHRQFSQTRVKTRIVNNSK